MMEDLSNDRSSKLHILSDLKRFILFILDKKFKTRIRIGVFLNSVRGKQSTDSLENVREKHVEQKKSYAGSTVKSYKIGETRAFGRKKKNSWYQ